MVYSIQEHAGTWDFVTYARWFHTKKVFTVRRVAASTNLHIDDGRSSASTPGTKAAWITQILYEFFILLNMPPRL